MNIERRIVIASRDASEYGNCERCGEPCVPHYKQQWRKVEGTHKGWVNCGYGHLSCLKNGEYENAEVIGEIK